MTLFTLSEGQRVFCTIACSLLVLRLREDTPPQLTVHVRRQFEIAKFTWLPYRAGYRSFVLILEGAAREIVRVWRRQVSSILRVHNYTRTRLFSLFSKPPGLVCGCVVLCVFLHSVSLTLGDLILPFLCM